MDEAALAKQRAEARRQRILAKQKDRLAGITGVYSSAATDPEPASTSAGESPSPALDAYHSSIPPAAAGAGAAAVKAPVTAAAAAAAAGAVESAAHEPGSAAAGGTGAAQHLPAFDLQAQVVGQLLQDVLASPNMQQDQQQHAAAATGMRLRQPLEHSDKPAAAAAAVGGVEPPLDTLINSFMQPSSRRAGGSSSNTIESSSSSLAPGAPVPVVPAVVRYSRAVTLAVRDSALLRLLSAALLAYAAVSGTYGPLEYPVRLPPVAVLWLLHAAVIASVALGYILLRPGALLVDPDAASSSSSALPMRLRTVNLLALVPGLQELSSVLGGYQQLLAALSVDAATHVVALGLLLAQQ